MRFFGKGGRGIFKQWCDNGDFDFQGWGLAAAFFLHRWLVLTVSAHCAVLSAYAATAAVTTCCCCCHQILAMSATVQNPEALGGWISEVHGACETVKTQFRPVPLQWGFAHKSGRKGALLENLLMEPGGGAVGKQQQDGSSSNGSGRGISSSNGGSGVGLSCNPGLKLDLWIHQELK